MRGRRLGDCDDGWALNVGNMAASFSGDFSSSTHLTELNISFMLFSGFGKI